MRQGVQTGFNHGAIFLPWWVFIRVTIALRHLRFWRFISTNSEANRQEQKREKFSEHKKILAMTAIGQPRAFERCLATKKKRDKKNRGRDANFTARFRDSTAPLVVSQFKPLSTRATLTNVNPA